MNIVTCGKCKGSGKYIFNNGTVSFCYACNGKGKLQQITKKLYAGMIATAAGEEPTHILNVTAKSESEALRKVKTTFARGCYKEFIDTAAVKYKGETNEYKTIK